MLSSDALIGYPTARLFIKGFPIEILHVVAILFLTVLNNFIKIITGHEFIIVLFLPVYTFCIYIDIRPLSKSPL